MSFFEELRRDFRRNAETSAFDAALRIDRLQALQALHTIPMACSLAGSLLVWWELRDFHSPGITVWLLAAMALVLLDLLTRRNLPRPQPTPRQVDYGYRRAIAICFLYGVHWGGLALLFYGSADAAGRHVIILFLIAFVSSAPLVLAAVPSAVVAFVLPVVLQLIVTFAANGVAEHGFLLQMTVIYLVAFPLTLRNYWRAFADRTRAMVEVEEHQHLVAVMLDDFKTNSRDRLWHTDAKLRFQPVSARFRNAAASAADPMINVDIDEVLSSLFAVDGEVDAGAREAVRLMRGREPFRDIAVSLVQKGEERWWLVSGSPSFLRDGTFAGYRGIARDITEKRRAERELTFLAHHDSLTGGANRASFNQELERIGKVVVRGGSRFALIQFDLDDFKAVNDTAGHAAGDEVLCAAYQRMSEGMPEGAFLARMGGDEFAAILKISPATQRVEVRQLVESMVSAVSRPIEATAGLFRIGASAGVALMPDDGQNPHAVMQLADIALYNAKADDVNRVHLASAEDGVAYSYRKILERDLRSAVDRQEFTLYFQPIVDAMSGRALVMEALIRWRHPRFGFVSPGEFIPIAEQTGSIQQIGQWALREACRQATTWPEAIGVAVNISPRQLDRDDLGTNVLEALRSSGLKPDRLELEITESAFLSGVDRVRRTVKRLQGFGVTVAMDDFGTGYSSLSSLQDVPFDKLKIDQSLVARDRSERRAVSILKSIIAIGSALDLHVTAEGVETAEQAAFLKGLGCNSLQGYLFARPMPPDELPLFFAGEAKRMLQPSDDEPGKKRDGNAA